MNKIISVIVISCLIQACTTKDMYDIAASHQCQEEANNSIDAGPAECWKSDEIDGRTYEEYKREREELERDKK